MALSAVTRPPGNARFRRLALLAGILGSLLALLLWVETRTLDTSGEPTAPGPGEREALRAHVRRGLDGAWREMTEASASIARDPALLAAIEGAERERALLFDVLDSRRASWDGIEVLDRSASRVAWSGIAGPMPESALESALNGFPSNAVVRTPASSQLCLAYPVLHNEDPVGAVIVRHTLELSFPLADAYLKTETFVDRLSRKAGTGVRFLHQSDPLPVQIDPARLVPLVDPEGRNLGRLIVDLPDVPARAEGVLNLLRIGRGTLLLLLLATLGIALLRMRRSLPNPILSSLLALAALWGGRLLLAALDMPGSLVPGLLFDSSLYASGFGFGIARSVGDLLLTVTTVALSIWYVATLIPPRPHGPSAGHVPFRAGAALLISLGLFAALRGYAAVVQSAVTDSTMDYAGPGSLVEPFPMMIMLLCLVALGLFFVVVSVGGARYIFRLFPSGTGWWGRSALTILLFALTTIVLDRMLNAPPLSVPFQLAVGAGIVILASMHRLAETVFQRFPSLATLTATSLVMLVPLLYSYSVERDRRLVETFAEEALRPVDTWLTFVVDDGLDRLVQSAGAATADLPPGERNRLAFRAWAASVAGREGYPAVFAVADSNGTTTSRFAIGGKSVVFRSVESELGDVEKKSLVVRELGRAMDVVRVYAGRAPIRGPDGARLAVATVLVAAGEGPLFRSDSPMFLRTPGREREERLRNSVILSEFREGRLLAASAPVFPVGYRLPLEVQSIMAAGEADAVWWRDRVNEAEVETYYVRRPVGPATAVVGVSLPVRGMPSFLPAVARLLASALLGLALVGITTLTMRVLLRRPIAAGFRDRLLAALVATAIVPLILIALYGSDTARQRLRSANERVLEDQAAAVGAAIDAPWSGSWGNAADAYARAEEIGTQLGTDFDLYRGDSLLATTRPELFDLGLRDRRLPGEAYASLVLRGGRFHVDTDRIGSLGYIVGYRPLLTDEEYITGIVAVPTLFRRTRIESETTEQNAILFILLVVVATSLVVIAWAFANRIAAPILTLTAATGKVARGNLETRVDLGSVDRLFAGRELGELTSSFNVMTSEVRRGREDLARAERELAWREMAQRVAHEIKNPLTPMKLSVQHLRQRFRDGDRDFASIFDEVTRTVLEQIDTLGRIASEFSHFGRMPSRNPVACDVHDVVRDAARLFATHGGIRFELAFTHEQVHVMADRDELRRTFVNVFRNAVQAMEGRGTVVVRTRAERAFVQIDVEDSGPGIPEELRSRVFEPRFSTKSDGMGLGLALVKSTVSELGGSVEVGGGARGAVISIRLPLAVGRGEQQ